MKIQYMFITNDTEVAKICDEFGVDRIFVDMEWMGKAERQAHLDSIKSSHTIQDISKIKKVVSRSKVLARVNPVHEGTKEEVTNAINAGADIIMLPMARSVDDARVFLSAVNKNAVSVLLLETKDAVRDLDEILDVGFDEVHIGLNDLSLDYKIPFMFDLLANGVVENICTKLRKRSIPYGFGGVARAGAGKLPAEYILMEHVRLGSTRAILSRSFCNTASMKEISNIRETFSKELPKLRQIEKNCYSAQPEDFFRNIERIKAICTAN